MGLVFLLLQPNFVFHLTISPSFNSVTVKYKPQTKTLIHSHHSVKKISSHKSQIANLKTLIHNNRSLFRCCASNLRPRISDSPPPTVRLPNPRLLKSCRASSHKSQVDLEGDDCVSIVNASSNIKMKNIACGPGHGISFSAYVWKWCRIKLQIPAGHRETLNLADETKLIAKEFKTKNLVRDIARVVLSISVWVLWRERNDRIFNGKATHKRKLCDIIMNYVLIIISKSKKHSGSTKRELDLQKEWGLDPIT